MQNIKGTRVYKWLAAIIGVALVCTPSIASAQSGIRSIDGGTTIYVRTIEEIDTNDTDGRIYRGVVDRDISNGNRILVPRGSDVELLVRRISDDELALDLDSISVNGRTFGVEAEQSVIASERKEGIGTNDRTAKHVGGGAVLGAIIGAIAGGGKGAAIGAGAGAAAGAGVQVLTRGHSVRVPEETLLTFRLTEPLRPWNDSGFMRNGQHYHNVSSVGRTSSYGAATISVSRDRVVSWRAPANASVYIQVDNRSPRFVASGREGNQRVRWMDEGHIYTAILMDRDKHEIARSQLDLRSGL